MSLSTLKENGYIEVAKERENPPVKIYYELHGDGPQHVVLIMGTFLYFFFIFMRIILN